MGEATRLRMENWSEIGVRPAEMAFMPGQVVAATHIYVRVYVRGLELAVPAALPPQAG